jgi:predicted dehydrogenase
MKTHRVAVVGCGMLARSVHLPNCVKNPRVKLVATCDADASVAEASRKEFGAERAETDWRNLITAPDIDCFILATHTNLRGAFISAALAAGKPVYTEKPLAPSRAEMMEIVAAARRTGVPVCVGHNRRSSPAILEVKRLMDRVRSGAPSYPPTVFRGKDRPPVPEQGWQSLLLRVMDDARSWKDWIFHDEEGILFSEMVHFIDLALWLTPAHPVRVIGEGSVRGNFTLIYRFDDGSMATLHHTLAGHFDYPKELLEASVRHVTIAMDQHIEVRQCGLDDEAALKTFPWADDSPWAEARGMSAYFSETQKERALAKREKRDPRWLNVTKGHASHLDRFLTHLEGRGENPCPVESAVAVNRLALKSLEAVRTGHPVALGPEDWHVV